MDEAVETAGPSCRRCAHYYVTWDPRRPCGCRAMGFKSRTLPCLVVLRHSGVPCRAFSPKPREPRST